MVKRCGQQLRVGPGGAFGLDFGAVMAMGVALHADTELLAEVLPAVEVSRLNSLSEEGEDDGDD